MPTYSVGASYLSYLRYPKTSIDKDIKDDICASLYVRGLGYRFLFYFPF